MSPLQNNILKPPADPDECDMSSLPVIIIDEQGNPTELTSIGEENGSKLLVDNAPATTEISENNPQLLDKQLPAVNNTDDWMKRKTHKACTDSWKLLDKQLPAVNNTDDWMKRKTHKACTDSWTATEERRKGEQGKTYLGRKQNAEGDWTYDVKRSNRIMKVRCSCKLSRKNKGLMCSSVTEEQRKQIFTDFWALSWKEKRVYIQMLCVFKRARDRKETEKSKRSFSKEYYLKVGGDRVKVCKTIYSHTLSIGEWIVRNWLKNSKKSGADMLENNSRDDSDGVHLSRKRHGEEKKLKRIF
ncbi:hypothetical protein QE152_g38193 [Popillia japonica]|uniref:Uncharacterized protein n=1 Tax=Popillia japonica TaxID=7064 RepID=A0AAW1I832_POPJA